MKKDWIVFFSQTGTEIVDIAESLGRWPDKIITNKRPENLRKINDKLLGKEIVYLPNKPSLKDYQEILNKHDDLIITLHGWLRIMPAEICNEYAIFNGHPGLITDYPELKGKDPQVRAYEGIKNGQYPVAGAVIHKVTAGVDEGKVIMEERFNTFQLELDELFRILRDRSLYMWCDFLKKIL
jgi:folate-dependent phosphoribosylglycinamide formyltransferase PurN